MAKYLVTNGTSFTPFTYEELTAPLREMAEAHNATQDAYDAISMETAALAQYLSQNDDDSEARALYNNYMNRLSALQNGLWENGFTPETRRNLSSARTAYFQEIGKLKGAIERRQKESETYWNMKHQNPDLVTSRDPASYGLNDYLRDPNFGRDWYSYSGKDFEASVANEIKARAAELYRTGDVERYPELPWVLKRLDTEGFTNTETNEAGVVVDILMDRTPRERDAFYQKEGVSLPVQILVESLINRYNATGAREADLTKGERDRFLNYGKAGWSSGVLGKKPKEYEDEVYKENAEKRKMAYQSGLRMNEQDHQAKLTRENMILEAMLKGGGSGSGNGSGTVSGEYGTFHMGSPVQLTSPTYEDYVKATEKQAKKYRNGPVSLNSTDGKTSKLVYNEYQMADEVYGTEGREKVRRQFGGYDIALSPSQNGEGFVFTASNGATFNLDIHTPTAAERTKYGLGTDPSAVVVYDKDNGTYWEAGTKRVNEAIAELNKQVRDYRAQNSTLDLDDYMVTPKQQQKMRENETGFEATAPWSEFHEYKNAQSYSRMGSTIPLTGFERFNDKARENMGRAMVAAYDHLASSAGKDGKLGQGSRAAIHTVNKGGTTYSEKATTDLGAVLGTVKKEGRQQIDEESILDVSAVLEDIIHGRNGYNDGSAPMVRFITRNHPGTVFATEPIAFGTVADNVFNQSRRMLWNMNISPETRSQITHLSMSNQIALILEPVFNPAAAREMTQRESEDWGWMADQLLGADQNGEPYVPSFRRAGGVVTPATAKEVASDKGLRERIEYAVTVRMAVPTMGRFLDAINQ